MAEKSGVTTMSLSLCFLFFFFQAEDGIRYLIVTGVQTCALPIWLHRENLTAMLALESTFADPAAARAPEEFVADTIVRLSIEPVQRAVLRSLEVVKSRGHEYALGRHTFRIINGQGLEVYRRVQAPRGLQREAGAAFDPTTRVT